MDIRKWFQKVTTQRPADIAIPLDSSPPIASSVGNDKQTSALNATQATDLTAALNLSLEPPQEAEATTTEERLCQEQWKKNRKNKKQRAAAKKRKATSVVQPIKAESQPGLQLPSIAPESSNEIRREDFMASSVSSSTEPNELSAHGKRQYAATKEDLKQSSTRKRQRMQSLEVPQEATMSPIEAPIEQQVYPQETGMPPHKDAEAANRQSFPDSDLAHITNVTTYGPAIMFPPLQAESRAHGSEDEGRAEQHEAHSERVIVKPEPSDRLYDINYYEDGNNDNSFTRSPPRSPLRQPPRAPKANRNIVDLVALFSDRRTLTYNEVWILNDVQSSISAAIAGQCDSFVIKHAIPKTIRLSEGERNVLWHTQQRFWDAVARGALRSGGPAQSRLPASSIMVGNTEAYAPPRVRPYDDHPALESSPQRAAQQALRSWTEFTLACQDPTPEAALMAQHMVRDFCNVLAQRTGVVV